MKMVSSYTALYIALLHSIAPTLTVSLLNAEYM